MTRRRSGGLGRLGRDHVWSCDFVQDQPADGRPLKILTLIDEHSPERLAIDVARSLKHRGRRRSGSPTCSSAAAAPEFIRSDNGAEFTENAVRDWLREVNVKTSSIESERSRRAVYISSFGRQAAERAVRRRIDRYAVRNQGDHQTLETALQRRLAAQLAALSPPGSRDDVD